MDGNEKRMDDSMLLGGREAWIKGKYGGCVYRKKDLLFFDGSFVYERVIALGEVADDLLDFFHRWLFHF